MIMNLLSTPAVSVSTGTRSSLNIGEILRVVGFWGIFSRFGESGWKSIIPIYREWIWSKIVGREDVGKKYVIVAILLVVILVIMGVALALGLVTASFEETTLTDGTVSSQIAGFSTTILAVIGITTLLTAVLGIYSMVLFYRLGEAHVKLEHAASWLKWIWLFLPGFAAIYFGFIHNKYYFEAFWDKNYTPTNEPEKF